MIDKITLKQEADKLFASASYKVLWGSPAGEFFTSEKLGTLSLKPGQKLIKFERPDKAIETASDKKELNANDAIAKIKVIDSIEALKAFENDDRKSVKQVYGWKLKQLTAAINVVGAKTETGNGNADTDTQK